MSPLSILTPKFLDLEDISLKIFIAFGNPDFKTLYVSISSMQLLGDYSAHVLKASYSLSNI